MELERSFKKKKFMQEKKLDESNNNDVDCSQQNVSNEAGFTFPSNFEMPERKEEKNNTEFKEETNNQEESFNFNFSTKDFVFSDSQSSGFSFTFSDPSFTPFSTDPIVNQSNSTDNDDDLPPPNSTDELYLTFYNLMKNPIFKQSEEDVTTIFPIQDETDTVEASYKLLFKDITDE